MQRITNSLEKVLFNGSICVLAEDVCTSVHSHIDDTSSAIIRSILFIWSVFKRRSSTVQPFSLYCDQFWPGRWRQGFSHVLTLKMTITLKMDLHLFYLVKHESKNWAQKLIRKVFSPAVTVSVVWTLSLGLRSALAKVTNFHCMYCLFKPMKFVYMLTDLITFMTKPPNKRNYKSKPTVHHFNVKL